MELHEALVPMKPYIDYLTKRMASINMSYVGAATKKYNEMAANKKLPTVTTDDMASALVQGAFLLVGSMHHMTMMEAACGVLFGVEKYATAEWWSVNTAFKRVSDKMRGVHYDKICEFF